MSSSPWTATQWDDFHRTGVEPPAPEVPPFRLEGLETRDPRRVGSLGGDAVAPSPRAERYKLGTSRMPGRGAGNPFWFFAVAVDIKMACTTAQAALEWLPGRLCGGLRPREPEPG